MLCITGYTQEYIDECRSNVRSQVAAYSHLVTTARDQASIDTFEHLFFNNLVLQLDYRFVHRSRTMEKKDGNALNEVRALCNSLTENAGKMMVDKSVKANPVKSVLNVQDGAEIRLNEADFVRLAEAFFAEIESKFLLVPEMA
jgi:hypothetical protein